MHACGSAMLHRLLADGTSPLCGPLGPGCLTRELQSAAAALETPVR